MSGKYKEKENKNFQIIWRTNTRDLSFSGDPKITATQDQVAATKAWYILFDWPLLNWSVE